MPNPGLVVEVYPSAWLNTPTCRNYPISTQNQIRTQPPPLSYLNREYSAHLPELSIAHPKLHYDQGSEWSKGDWTGLASPI